MRTRPSSRSRSATLPQGSELQVRVTPRASRERTEIRDGVLRIYVTAAPVDGEANKAVVALVAKLLNVSKSCISIKRGGAFRDKVLWIEGLTAAELSERMSGA